MRFSIRLSFALSIFLALAGTVLAVIAWSIARQGYVLLWFCAIAAAYIGFALRHTEKRFAREEAKGEAEEIEEAEVTGTIWPFVLSIAMVFVVIGFVGIHWVTAIGVIILIVAGVGWFIDVQKQRMPHGGEAAPAAADGTSE
jgi:Cytochrome c oxidase subunit IV